MVDLDGAAVIDNVEFDQEAPDRLQPVVMEGQEDGEGGSTDAISKLVGKASAAD